MRMCRVLRCPVCLCNLRTLSLPAQMLDRIAALEQFDASPLEGSPMQLRVARKDAAQRHASGGGGRGGGGGGGAPLPREGGIARPSASHNPLSFSGVSNKTVRDPACNHPWGATCTCTLT